MKSTTKNYIIYGLAVLVLVLVLTPISDSIVLAAARQERKRYALLVDLNNQARYEFWKWRIFIAAHNRGETTEQTSPDGDIVYVLTHAKDDMPGYISDKSVID
ncbi:hypothetical protein ES703_35095 [subsurface metagenome]